MIQITKQKKIVSTLDFALSASVMTRREKNRNNKYLKGEKIEGFN